MQWPGISKGEQAPRSRLKRVLLLLLAAVVLLPGAGVLAIASLGPGQLGQTVIRNVLETELGEDVVVDGSFGLDLGSETAISFADLSVTNPGWRGNPEIMQVQRGKVVVELWPLIFGQLIARQVEIEGARITVETAADGRRNWPLQRETDTSSRDRLFARRIPVIEQVSITDAAIVYQDKQNGWDFDVRVVDLETRKLPDGRGMAIDGRASVNGTPATLGGVMETPDEDPSETARTFELTLDAPALEAQLQGQTGSPHGEGLEVTLTSRSASLGGLLEALKIERSVEGTGSLEAHFVERDGKLSVSGLTAEVVTRNGHTTRVTGTVDDVVRGAGLDIEFVSELARRGDVADEPSRLQEIRLLGFSGELGGSFDTILLKRFTVSTNAVEHELREIGTLEVHALHRDSRGHIGTTGIKAVSGSPENPALVVSGSIGDLLQLNEVDLSGSFHLATASILGLAASERDAAAGLGRLQGAFSMTDQRGSLAIDELSAEVVGTDLLDLSLSSIDTPATEPLEHSYDISVTVPRPDAVAGALGASVPETGAIGFAGVIGGGEQRVNAAGKATLGETAVSVDMQGDLSGETSALSGKLSTPLLHVSDAMRLYAATAQSRSPSSRTETSSAAAAGKPSVAARLMNGFDADIEVDVDKIAGSGERASELTGRIEAEEGEVSLRDFRARYLEGRIKADATVNANAKPARLTLNARVEHMPLGAVLQKLESRVPATGNLYFKLDLESAGETGDAILRSASGSFEAALLQGRVRSGLLRLSGLDLTSWLISTPTADGYTEIQCFIARFAVKQGMARTTALVMDTRDVLLRGEGSVDLRDQTLNINVVPRPKKRRLIEVVTPFSISGPIGDPGVKVRAGDVVTRGTGEVLLLPSNVLGNLVGLIAPGRGETGSPCRKE